VTSEVLSPPQVEGGLVVAQSIDGRLAAFDVLDGARRWLYSTSIPSLTLRGSSTPIINGDVVIAGFANGRVSILDRQRGLVHLDRRVGVSQGKSDLDRLVDIDGPMVLSGGTLYVVSYQGSLMSLDVATGRVNWAQDASSTAGVGMGFGTVYVAESNGRVVAIDAGNGKLLWETAALKFRELTTPAVIRSYVALGDLDGYVHLIAQADGRFVGREKVTRGALKSPMVVDESRLYIMTESGKLLVYELR
jgi:outer membrane protein assembly factor BamB